MSIILSEVSYHYFNQQILLKQINFSVLKGRKVSIIGDNGTGKSTLLKLLHGQLKPTFGAIQCSSQPYYIPQQISASGWSVSKALGIDEKINALHSIYNGSCESRYYEQLADDWDIESRCRTALDYWGLDKIDFSTAMDSLSGGEKTKVFLAGILIHEPKIILFDEPTNHLDQSSRVKFYNYINNCKATIIVVSHDKVLLDLLNTTYELSEQGIHTYGGNYSFYKEQKEAEQAALAQQINSEEVALRLARKKAQEVQDRQNKRSSQGKKSKEKGGVALIVMNARANLAENSSSKLKEKHAEIIGDQQLGLSLLKQKQRNSQKLKIDFESTKLHVGKVLLDAANINYAYTKDKYLWSKSLQFEVRSGERIRIMGDNGTGKSTLIQLLIGELRPTLGEVRRGEFSYIYLDQQYKQVHVEKTILELAREYNRNHLQDHEIKLRLNRALFPSETWDKSCQILSGGERMRLYLCCLMLSNHIPDMFILDEPTNNLDLTSLSILTNSIKTYRGTILLVSHDEGFGEEIGITREIDLNALEL